MNSSFFAEDLRRYVFAARVITVAATVPLLMRLPLPTLAEVLEPRRERAATADQGAAAEHVVRRVNAALRVGRPLLRAGCLTRGLTRYWFLRRAGVDVTLSFGTGRVNGALEAHCWVSLAGAPLDEPQEDRSFRELVRIVAPGVLVPAV